MLSDLAQGTDLHQESQTHMQRTDAGQTDQREADLGQQSQGQAHEGQVDQGLADHAQADGGETGAGPVHNDAAVEVRQVASARRRMTRASARQVALLQDMNASGVCHLLQWNQDALAAVMDIATPAPPSQILCQASPAFMPAFIML